MMIFLGEIGPPAKVKVPLVEVILLLMMILIRWSPMIVVAHHESTHELSFHFGEGIPHMLLLWMKVVLHGCWVVVVLINRPHERILSEKLSFHLFHHLEGI